MCSTFAASGESVASGVSCWHKFATMVLFYPQDKTLPPVSGFDVSLFICIFNCAGTAKNYVSAIRKACALAAVSTDGWDDEVVKQALRGITSECLRTFWWTESVQIPAHAGMDGQNPCTSAGAAAVAAGMCCGHCLGILVALAIRRTSAAQGCSLGQRSIGSSEAKWYLGGVQYVVASIGKEEASPAGIFVVLQVQMQ